MPWSEARGWFDCWQAFPPPAEMLSLIAAGLGLWRPKKDGKPEPKVSSEQDLLAFALFHGGL